MPGDGIVADANVLLSAAIGKAALRVFTDYGVRVHATRFNVHEVARYLPRLSAKYGLPHDMVQLQWRLLPVVVHPERRYEREMGWAQRALAGRDPDDAHPLALARSLGLDLWSNDRDLQGHGTPCHPTALLLQALEQGPSTDT